VMWQHFEGTSVPHSSHRWGSPCTLPTVTAKQWCSGRSSGYLPNCGFYVEQEYNAMLKKMSGFGQATKIQSW